MAQSRADAEAEGITIPKTVEEYCIKHKPIGSQSSETQVDPLEDWYDDDDYDEDDDEEDNSDCFNNEDDSGNEDWDIFLDIFWEEKKTFELNYTVKW